MSMAVVVMTACCLFTAADTREYPSGEVVQKLYPSRTGTFLAQIGMERISVPDGRDWIGHMVARDIAAALPGPPAAGIGDQLAFASQALADSLRGLRHVQSDLGPAAVHLILATRIAGVNLVGGVTVELRNAPDGTFIDIGEPVTTPGTPGKIDVRVISAADCPYVKTSDPVPGQELSWMVALIRDTAAQSDLCRKLIGGPILVGWIDADGQQHMRQFHDR